MWQWITNNIENLIANAISIVITISIIIKRTGIKRSMKNMKKLYDYEELILTEEEIKIIKQHRLNNMPALEEEEEIIKLKNEINFLDNLLEEDIKLFKEIRKAITDIKKATKDYEIPKNTEFMLKELDNEK